MPRRSRSRSRPQIVDRGSDGRGRGAGKRRSPSSSGDDRGQGRLRSWSRERQDRGKSKIIDRKASMGVPASATMTVGKPLKKVRKELFGKELGYKDESNPFGDMTLSDKFVWKKKNEYLAAAGLYKKTTKEQQLERTEAKIREIHQVKKRRDEREVERQLLEQQRLEHDRDMKDELFSEWATAEEKFHLENAKSRSLIRIEQGRERPIDLVAKGVHIASGEEFEDMTVLDKPPHQLFVAMSLQECEENLNEIATFIRNDSQHKGFWKAMKVCCQDALDQKQREKVGKARPGSALSGMGAGVAEGVTSDIHELLASKPKSELEDMLIEIKKNIAQGGAGIDTQFFDAVASKIPLYMARAEVEELHLKAKKRSEKWTEDHATQFAAATQAGSPAPEPDSSDEEMQLAQMRPKGDWDDLPAGNRHDQDDLSPELEPLSILEERHGPGACSPVLEPISAFDPQDLLDPEEDERILRQVRRTLIEAFAGPSLGSSADAALDRSKDDELFAQERAKGLAEGEAAFNAPGKGTGDDFHGEVVLPSRHYEWEDKYAPRKPRFFNRVKTGYEWTKYNQTHYDHDNPPPKVVQGYKFNIFYPDLIEKTAAPQYYIEKSDTADTATLRFHAGPPYEDVAFKIVNREWNLSHRFGFRVVFDRGVLQLYFNFKRHRYRR